MSITHIKLSKLSTCISAKNHQKPSPPNRLMPLPTRAGRRWHIAWRGPRLGFVAETGNSVTMDALSTIFFAFFVRCFLLFSFSPSFSRYVYPLRVPSFVQQPSATVSMYVVRVLSVSRHLHPASSRNSFILSVEYFFVVLISRVAFSLCSRTRYVST